MFSWRNRPHGALGRLLDPRSLRLVSFWHRCSFFLFENAESLDLLSKQIVFLTTGNRDLEHFQRCMKCHFVIRSVELPKSVGSVNGTLVWEKAEFLQARGPFTLRNELSLFRQYGVKMLVSKNSGGDSTYAKIEAARKLKIPVLMVDRPLVNTSDLCLQVNQVLDWIVQHKSA